MGPSLRLSPMMRSIMTRKRRRTWRMTLKATSPLISEWITNERQATKVVLSVIDNRRIKRWKRHTYSVCRISIITPCLSDLSLTMLNLFS